MDPIKSINMKIRKYCYILTSFLVVFWGGVKAQDVENELQPRLGLELSYSPLKDLKLNLVPEMRFEDNFELDRFLIEGGVSYELLKYIEVGGTYRFGINPRESKVTDYYHRYSLNITGKYKFDRFKTSLRLRYSNDADDEILDEEFFRYKAMVKYDIRNCKITPLAAIEAFKQTESEGLYKMRYITGLKYKLFDNNYLGAIYKLDYFMDEYRNRHILSLEYSIKF